MSKNLNRPILHYVPIFYNIERINPTISKVNVRVFYSGANKNRSRMTDEVAEQVAQSMLGAPIVGNYIEEIKDFDEHSGHYIVKEGKLVYKHTAVPYGFIPTNAKIWKESIPDDEGNIKDYYCTEGFLWTKRYPEAERILENKNHQSMEFDDETIRGKWTEEEDGAWYDIEYADILGLCILGEDVSPCFESADFISFSEYKKNSWTEFSNLVAEMFEDIKEGIGEGIVGAESTKPAVVTFNNHEPERIFKIYTTGMINKYKKGGTRMAIKFEIPQNSILVDLYKAINPYDKENDSYALKFSIQEVKEDHIIAFCNDNQSYYKINFNKDGEGAIFTEAPQKISSVVYNEKEEDTNSYKEMVENYATYKETAESVEGKEIVDTIEYTTMKDTVEGLKDKTVIETATYTALKEQADSVAGLKAQISEYSEAVVKLETEKKEQLITDFAMLGEEVINTFKEKIAEYSYDDLKKELSVLGFENKVNYSAANGKEPFRSYSGDNDVSFEKLPAWVQAVKKLEKNNEEE